MMDKKSPKLERFFEEFFKQTPECWAAAIPFHNVGILCDACLMCENRIPEVQRRVKISNAVCRCKKSAVARCFDCPDFLCAPCLSVHQQLRVFETHKVHLIDKSNITHSHIEDALVYYCDSCLSPICVGCMLSNIGKKDVLHDNHSASVAMEKTSETSARSDQLIAPPRMVTYKSNVAPKKPSFDPLISQCIGAFPPASQKLPETQTGFSKNNKSFVNEIPIKIKYKVGQYGAGLGQFSCPRGFCLGFDEEIVVADTNNHRIQVFKKDYRYFFSYAFGNPGKKEGFLWYPSKVAFMKKFHNYLVYDGGIEFSRLQIFSKIGTFIKSIDTGFIDNVGGLLITRDDHIVVMDCTLSTLNILSENGDRLQFYNLRDCMNEPTDFAIHNEEYFVCDYKGQCVMVFGKEGQVIRQIGFDTGLKYPNGIDISDDGDILVGDSCDKRFQVSVFSHDGTMLCKFRCPPQDKVNKCYGLRITSEGHVLTLGQNNHQLIILDPLYV